MMQYREITDARLRVSRIGLGLAALGRPGYINLGHAEDLLGLHNAAALEEHTHQVLQEAWKLGIRYFDVARSYGRGEKFLGTWLRENNIPENEVLVGSKWGYTYTANWQIKAAEHEHKQHSLSQLDKQREESNLLLGGYLKLYQIHSVTLESGVLENRLVLDKLHALKMHGMHIGLSVSGTHQAEAIQKARSIVYDNEQLFETVQATWNLLEQSAGEALAEAHADGWGVIIKEGLANGRLTPRNQDPAFKERMQLLEQMSIKTHYSIDALALAAILAQPWADVVLSGAANQQQLRANLEALKLKLSTQQLLQLLSIKEESAQYWETRSTLEWN